MSKEERTLKNLDLFTHEIHLDSTTKELKVLPFNATELICIFTKCLSSKLKDNRLFKSATILPPKQK